MIDFYFFLFFFLEKIFWRTDKEISEEYFLEYSKYVIAFFKEIPAVGVTPWIIGFIIIFLYINDGSDARL